MTTNKDFKDFFDDLFESKKKKMKEKESGSPIEVNPYLKNVGPEIMEQVPTTPKQPASSIASRAKGALRSAAGSVARGAFRTLGGPVGALVGTTTSVGNGELRPEIAQQQRQRLANEPSLPGGGTESRSATNRDEGEVKANPNQPRRNLGTPRTPDSIGSESEHQSRVRDLAGPATMAPGTGGLAKNRAAAQSPSTQGGFNTARSGTGPTQIPSGDSSSPTPPRPTPPTPANEPRDPGTGERLSSGKDLNRLRNNAERDPGTGELKSDAKDLGAISRMQSEPPPPPRPTAPAPVARSSPAAPRSSARSNDTGSAAVSDDDFTSPTSAYTRRGSQPETESGPRKTKMKMTESRLIDAFTQLMNSKNPNLFEASKKMKKGESSPPPPTGSRPVPEQPEQVPPNKTGTKPINTQRNEEVDLDEKTLASLAPPKDKVTRKDVLVGRGVLKKHPSNPNKHVVAKEDSMFSDAELEHIYSVMEEPRSKEHDDAVAEYMKKGGKVTKLPAQKPEKPEKLPKPGTEKKEAKQEAKKAEEKLGIPSVQKKTGAGYPVASHLVAKQEKARSKALSSAKARLGEIEAEKKGPPEDKSDRIEGGPEPLTTNYWRNINKDN